MSFPVGSLVRVLHSYVPPKSHCLRLQIGELIQVVDSKNTDLEWVAGKNSEGKIGFFPALYVEQVKKEKSEDKKEQQQQVEKTTTTTMAVVASVAPVASMCKNIDPTFPSPPTATATATQSLRPQDIEEKTSQRISKGKSKLHLNRLGSHRGGGGGGMGGREKNHSIGSVPSPRWLAPAHLTTVALFKYFADGHFGIDNDSLSKSGGLFKKRTHLKVADLLKFGKKPIKLPLHRSLWTSDLEERAKAGTIELTTGMIVKSQHMQKRAVENFKNIMRYMNDLETESSFMSSHHATVSTMNMLAKDGLRSQVLQLGLSSGDMDGSPMCDEIWCQLIKQTTSNPKHESMVAGTYYNIYVHTHM